MSATPLTLNRRALSATCSTSVRGGWYKQCSRHYRRTALLHTEDNTSPWQLTQKSNDKNPTRVQT
jgi:hypothetical protein